MRDLKKIVAARFHQHLDYIYVGPGALNGDVELRFGDGGKGSRTARLRPNEARLIAYALLSAAEQVSEQAKPK